MLACGVAHIQHFLLGVFLMREGHGDHVFRGAFIDTCQHRAGEDAIVFAPAANKVGQDHSVNQPMWVVGHQHDWTLKRNILNLRVRGLQIDAHRLHRGGPKGLACGLLFFLKLTDTSDDRQFSGEQLDRLNDRAFDRAGERRGIRQAAPVVDRPAVVDALLCRIFIHNVYHLALLT